MATNGDPVASFQDDIRRETYKVLAQSASIRPFDQLRQRELWSTYLFAPGAGNAILAGTYDLFTVVKGGTGQGYATPLTFRESNWALGGQLSRNQNLVFRSIHAQIKRTTTDRRAYDPAVLPPAGTIAAGQVDLNVPPHPADVLRVAYGMVLVLQYLTDEIPIGLVADYPSPGGVVGFNEASRQIAAAAGAAPAFATTPAGAGSRPYLPIAHNACNALFERRYRIPSLLRNGDVFSMKLRVPIDIPLLAINPASGPNGESNDASGCLEVRLSIFATESFNEQS